MAQKPDKEKAGNRDLRAILLAIDTEVNRQLADHVRSAGALTNRAALLVTSALIFVSIPKGGTGDGWWYTIAICSAVIAAVLGVVALFFRPTRQETKLDSLESQLAGVTEIEAIRKLTDSKRTTLRHSRKRVNVTA